MKQTEKAAPPKKKTRRRARSPRRILGIREADEARALLEKQLHSLYWWIFNACRIKGFVRAEHLDELEAQRESAVSGGDEFGEPELSAKSQVP